MQINVTPSAVDCLVNEWDFQEGDHVRVFVRYSGGGGEPFALGIGRDEPRDPLLTTEAGKITFYMERHDIWFLEGNNITIDCSGGEDIEFRIG
ncbi:MULTISPECIES: HesB/YadR/YfhF family protein [unclassified Paenibacillus]|uniref:HesB/YadR/YfhF family protein n=1 Tax=unclassified Paenibacillus TaxID=185978 RepID=UPI001C1010F0|nr:MULTISPECIES: Fe-S cluster assembly protein HesB [unclassified Paenibacillus]MBU5441305.1 Fe-S cluster assembly protein HesB [Paenibacillus sp. MSJ-34]CAH0120871.1 hypothetical protein PAE9249_03395 [Paenibacillus sp. CECT 9249]